MGGVCAVTFVVHVGGHLHHAEAQVDRQVVKVVVGLQEELSPQLHVVSQLVHFIDQHRVEVFVLEKRGTVTEPAEEEAFAYFLV